MFATMRFCTGLGLSGISISSFVLYDAHTGVVCSKSLFLSVTSISVIINKKKYIKFLHIGLEWVEIRHRTTVAVLMSLDWSVGCVILPGVAYLINDWRFLTAAVISPLFPAMLCWWWLPESARWLMSNGKTDDAHFYLSRCATVNGREDVLSTVILVEDENRKYSYLDLVKTPKMRRRALLSGIVWFGVAFAYYGISLNISGFGVNIYLTQFIYGVIEIPAKGFVFFTVDKIGRRWNQAGMLILTGLLIFIFNLLINSVKTVGALGKMFSEGSFTIVFLYTTELYPTVMRQNGLGYCSFMARVGVAVSPLIMLLEDVWVNLPSFVFSLVALGSGLSASLLPETYNVRLPETIEDVEQTTNNFIIEQQPCSQ
uniref:Solute carrier family 22 member 7b, tandem duplicate 1 n=1 Tax=Astatotilapia calliptera TaxID=8154 RepID=A0AAX7V8C8_ASTCA